MDKKTINIVKKLLETGSKLNEEKLGKDEVNMKCVDLKEEFADFLFQLMYIVNKQSIKLMNIQVPLENVLPMLEAIQEFG